MIQKYKILLTVNKKIITKTLKKLKISYIILFKSFNLILSREIKDFSTKYFLQQKSAKTTIKVQNRTFFKPTLNLSILTILYSLLILVNFPDYSKKFL